MSCLYPEKRDGESNHQVATSTKLQNGYSSHMIDHVAELVNESDCIRMSQDIH